MDEKGEKFISLKEAAQISGYSSDYIGQLIRKGKLPGKQIYSNVAWVTTEKAVRSYMEGALPKNGGEEGVPWLERKIAILGEQKLIRRITILLWLILGVSVVFALVLFYIFSVGLERTLDRRATEKIEMRQAP